MWADFRKTIRRHWRMIVVTAGITMLMMWMYVSMFPTIQKEAEKMNELLAAFPQSMIQVFGIEGGDLFTSIESFLTVEYYSLLWPLLIIILAISLAVPVVAGEVEDGTMDLLLSLPMSRIKHFIATYGGGVVVMTIFVLISVLCVYPFGWAYGVEVSSDAHFTLLLAGWLFGVATYSLDVAISTFFSSKGAALSVMTAWIFLMYLANVFASLQESVKWMQDVSFFHYFDYKEALQQNSVPVESLIVFSVTILISIIVGMFWFRKRDIYS